MGVGVTRLLPARFWFRIREEARLVKRMDYERHPIYICVDSWIENDVRLHSCIKEPGTVEWIENWFKPGEVFYDIGANVGAYSLVAFRFLDGKIKVFAFEPGFVTFPQLCRNIYLNGASDSIVPFQVALSDENSMVGLHYNNLLSGGALHALGDPVNQHGKVFEPVFTLPTLSYRLDDLLRQVGLPVPNHMKIDVDGNEYQVLQGSEETLRSSELRSILMEINKERGDTDEIGELLDRNGFVLHSQRNEQSVYCRRDMQL
ncbi:MAG: FkbM family methyltransferase [Gammaproteobacteria bacterium]|nr:FkbM family methyltransferase [Gammaproteobacteria bacterium]